MNKKVFAFEAACWGFGLTILAFALLYFTDGGGIENLTIQPVEMYLKDFTWITWGTMPYLCGGGLALFGLYWIFLVIGSFL